MYISNSNPSDMYIHVLRATGCFVFNLFNNIIDVNVYEMLL